MLISATYSLISFKYASGVIFLALKGASKCKGFSILKFSLVTCNVTPLSVASSIRPGNPENLFGPKETGMSGQYHIDISCDVFVLLTPKSVINAVAFKQV